MAQYEENLIGPAVSRKSKTSVITLGLPVVDIDITVACKNPDCCGKVGKFDIF